MNYLAHSSLLLGFAFVAFCIFLIPAILYILTLQKALAKCAESSRTMQPGMVWLLIVPFVNIVWNFLVVIAMAKSLGAEFSRRGIPTSDPLPGQTIGLTMAICACCGIIPILGVLASLASLVCWILYWIKISEYSKMLDGAPAAVAAPPLA